MAIINSFTFLVIVRSGVKNAVFAYCWVIVEPPWAFNDPDFKHLVRIYYSNQDTMKEFFSYIVSGDITKLTVNKTEKNYENEIQILQSLVITESNENIQKCLESVNGHLNLALRLLLCKSSLL